MTTEDTRAAVFIALFINLIKAVNASTYRPAVNASNEIKQLSYIVSNESNDIVGETTSPTLCPLSSDLLNVTELRDAVELDLDIVEPERLLDAICTDDVNIIRERFSSVVPSILAAFCAKVGLLK